MWVETLYPTWWDYATAAVLVVFLICVGVWCWRESHWMRR
jgi:hypothetical protein